MMATILDFVSTVIQMVTTAGDMRRRFFNYGLCLLLLAVSGGFVIASAGFLLWALYDGLSVGMASPNSARLILCVCSFSLAGMLMWAAKKTID